MTKSITNREFVKHSVSIEGYDWSFAYNPQSSFSYGHWICKRCLEGFFTGAALSLAEIHNPDCEYFDKGNIASKDLVYVICSNETAKSSCIDIDDGTLERIKKLAKDAWHPEKNIVS